MMWGNDGQGSWSWSWVFGTLAVVGVIVLVVLAVRVTSSSRTRSNAGAPPVVEVRPSPKQILDERYAQGELTTEEYRERLTALGHHP